MHCRQQENLWFHSYKWFNKNNYKWKYNKGHNHSTKYSTQYIKGLNHKGLVYKIEESLGW